MFFRFYDVIICVYCCYIVIHIIIQIRTRYANLFYP